MKFYKNTLEHFKTGLLNCYSLISYLHFRREHCIIWLFNFVHTSYIATIEIYMNWYHLTIKFLWFDFVNKFELYGINLFLFDINLNFAVIYFSSTFGWTWHHYSHTPVHCFYFWSYFCAKQLEYILVLFSVDLIISLEYFSSV